MATGMGDTAVCRSWKQSAEFFPRPPFTWHQDSWRGCTKPSEWVNMKQRRSLLTQFSFYHRFSVDIKRQAEAWEAEEGGGTHPIEKRGLLQRETELKSLSNTHTLFDFGGSWSYVVRVLRTLLQKIFSKWDQKRCLMSTVQDCRLTK